MKSCDGNVLRFILVVFFYISAQVVNGQNAKVLRMQLMKDYDKASFPPAPVNLNVGFNILSYDMNEKDQSIDADFWITMEWHDNRLGWDNSDVELLHFDPNTLWLPDLMLYNNADQRDIVPYSPTQAIVYPDGKVLWIPPAHAKAFCFMDMTYWPHDVHKCHFKFGSWVHNEGVLNITTGKLTMEDMFMTPEGLNLGEWQLESSELTRQSITYECCPEPYVDIKLNLTLKRNSIAYNTLVRTSLIALCLLTVVMFILPPASSEKTLLGGIALFLDFIFLWNLAQIISNSPNHVPLIMKLVSNQLILTAVSLVLSSSISRMMNAPKGNTLPYFIKNLLVKLAPVLCLGGYCDLVDCARSRGQLKGEEVQLKEPGEQRDSCSSVGCNSQTNADWMLLGVTLDRLCFVAFLIAFIVMATCAGKIL